MSNQVRLGIVGTGSISLRGLLPHLSMDDVQDRVNITAVCDPVLERAQAAAAKFNVPNAYATMEEMMEAGAVDAVSIASPIGFHFDQGMLAVENGVHVHFNKTMTTTVDEANKLIAAANAKRVKLVSSPGELINPRLQRIKEMVEAGELGTLTWAMTGATFGRYHENESRVRGGSDPLTNVNPAWYFRKPGGGPLFDMTVYGLHALTAVVGPAKRVTALSGVRIKEREFNGEMLPTDMDDQTLMVVDFGDAFFGFVYGVAAGRFSPGRPHIMGTKGTINGGELNGEPIDYPGKAIADEFGYTATLPHVVGQHRQMEEAHVYEDVMQLVDWVRDDKPTLATADHARHVIEIFDAGYRSAETGQVQALTTTF
ncbi:MAG: Gfo/Idh/MocA family oxidoreductase [Caldilineaceae bacterium]